MAKIRIRHVTGSVRKKADADILLFFSLTPKPRNKDCVAVTSELFKTKGPKPSRGNTINFPPQAAVFAQAMLSVVGFTTTDGVKWAR